ncbi:Cat eye syndrome critical region protein 5 [Rhypophila decipiens]|uniref:Cat eye syndrome critical region protein 5 n=1 Tax=Rhypophila decipiens TaxID=261697 RepID=A0AAN6Y9V1_9PEZI|nr:Cat eye syndrome critical region protein 5 [Rhypophila decipiens]
MSSLAPSRPGLQRRQISSSSFADAFESARSNLAKFDHNSDDDDDDIVSPGLSLADSLTEEESADTPPSPITPATHPGTPRLDPDVADDFAFAFDIDGVLIRGGQPIPEAIEAMKVLNGENEFGISVPYIFLTNGGGKFETERCRDLSRQLEIEVSPGQFICGHTPMKQYASHYNNVLVVGGEGEKCRNVAESYGFRNVITPGDILKANAATAPFRKLTDSELNSSRDLLEGGTKKLSDIVIDAVFVFADSRDWASDLQIILDIAQSKGGRLETRSETFEEGPPIYFSHSDVLWSAAHEHVRLGMGALRRIVETVFAETSGGKQLKTHAFGKPQLSTFQFATRLLQQWRAEHHGLVESAPPRTVYFVGDTPESDICGTNLMDEKTRDSEWYSILVKTGVYQEGTVPKHMPRKLVGNVLDAVNHGIQREMARRSRALDTTSAGALSHGLSHLTPNFDLDIDDQS